MARGDFQLPRLPDIQAPEVALPDIQVPQIAIPDLAVPDLSSAAAQVVARRNPLTPPQTPPLASPIDLAQQAALQQLAPQPEPLVPPEEEMGPPTPSADPTLMQAQIQREQAREGSTRLTMQRTGAPRTQVDKGEVPTGSYSLGRVFDDALRNGIQDLSAWMDAGLTTLGLKTKDPQAKAVHGLIAYAENKQGEALFGTPPFRVGTEKPLPDAEQGMLGRAWDKVAAPWHNQHHQLLSGPYQWIDSEGRAYRTGQHQGAVAPQQLFFSAVGGWLRNRQTSEFGWVQMPFSAPSLPHGAKVLAGAYTHNGDLYALDGQHLKAALGVPSDQVLPPEMQRRLYALAEASKDTKELVQRAFSEQGLRFLQSGEASGPAAKQLEKARQIADAWRQPTTPIDDRNLPWLPAALDPEGFKQALDRVDAAAKNPVDAQRKLSVPLARARKAGDSLAFSLAHARHRERGPLPTGPRGSSSYLVRTQEAAAGIALGLVDLLFLAPFNALENAGQALGDGNVDRLVRRNVGATGEAAQQMWEGIKEIPEDVLVASGGSLYALLHQMTGINPYPDVTAQAREMWKHDAVRPALNLMIGLGAAARLAGAVKFAAVTPTETAWSTAMKGAWKAGAENEAAMIKALSPVGAGKRAFNAVKESQAAKVAEDLTRTSRAIQAALGGVDAVPPEAVLGMARDILSSQGSGWRWMAEKMMSPFLNSKAMAGWARALQTLEREVAPASMRQADSIMKGFDRYVRRLQEMGVSKSSAESSAWLFWERQGEVNNLMRRVARSTTEEMGAMEVAAGPGRTIWQEFEDLQAKIKAEVLDSGVPESEAEAVSHALVGDMMRKSTMDLELTDAAAKMTFRGQDGAELTLPARAVLDAYKETLAPAHQYAVDTAFRALDYQYMSPKTARDLLADYFPRSAKREAFGEMQNLIEKAKKKASALETKAKLTKEWVPEKPEMREAVVKKAEGTLARAKTLQTKLDQQLAEAEAKIAKAKAMKSARVEEAAAKLQQRVEEMKARELAGKPVERAQQLVDVAKRELAEAKGKLRVVEELKPKDFARQKAYIEKLKASAEKRLKAEQERLAKATAKWEKVKAKADKRVEELMHDLAVEEALHESLSAAFLKRLQEGGGAEDALGKAFLTGKMDVAGGADEFLRDVFGNMRKAFRGPGAIKGPKAADVYRTFYHTGASAVRAAARKLDMTNAAFDALDAIRAWSKKTTGLVNDLVEGKITPELEAQLRRHGVKAADLGTDVGRWAAAVETAERLGMATFPANMAEASPILQGLRAYLEKTGWKKASATLKKALGDTVSGNAQIFDDIWLSPASIRRIPNIRALSGLPMTMPDEMAKFAHVWKGWKKAVSWAKRNLVLYQGATAAVRDAINNIFSVAATAPEGFPGVSHWRTAQKMMAAKPGSGVRRFLEDLELADATFMDEVGVHSDIAPVLSRFAEALDAGEGWGEALKAWSQATGKQLRNGMSARAAVDPFKRILKGGAVGMVDPFQTAFGKWLAGVRSQSDIFPRFATFSDTLKKRWGIDLGDFFKRKDGDFVRFLGEHPGWQEQVKAYEARGLSAREAQVNVFADLREMADEVGDVFVRYGDKAPMLKFLTDSGLDPFLTYNIRMIPRLTDAAMKHPMMALQLGSIFKILNRWQWALDGGDYHEWDDLSSAFGEGRVVVPIAGETNWKTRHFGDVTTPTVMDVRYFSPFGGGAGGAVGDFIMGGLPQKVFLQWAQQKEAFPVAWERGKPVAKGRDLVPQGTNDPWVATYYTLGGTLSQFLPMWGGIAAGAAGLAGPSSARPLLDTLKGKTSAMRPYVPAPMGGAPVQGLARGFGIRMLPGSEAVMAQRWAGGGSEALIRAIAEGRPNLPSGRDPWSSVLHSVTVRPREILRGIEKEARDKAGTPEGRALTQKAVRMRLYVNLLNSMINQQLVAPLQWRVYQQGVDAGIGTPGAARIPGSAIQGLIQVVPDLDDKIYEISQRVADGEAGGEDLQKAFRETIDAVMQFSRQVPR